MTPKEREREDIFIERAEEEGLKQLKRLLEIGDELKLVGDDEYSRFFGCSIGVQTISWLAVLVKKRPELVKPFVEALCSNMSMVTNLKIYIREDD